MASFEKGLEELFDEIIADEDNSEMNVAYFKEGYMARIKSLFLELIEECNPGMSGPIEQTLNYDAKGERVRSMEIRYTEKQKGWNEAIQQYHDNLKEKING